MAMMTMIARVIDGLPLVGTMQENEEVLNTNFKLYKRSSNSKKKYF